MGHTRHRPLLPLIILCSARRPLLDDPTHRSVPMATDGLRDPCRLSGRRSKAGGNDVQLERDRCASDGQRRAAPRTARTACAGEDLSPTALTRPTKWQPSDAAQAHRARRVASGAVPARGRCLHHDPLEGIGIGALTPPGGRHRRSTSRAHRVSSPRPWARTPPRAPPRPRRCSSAESAAACGGRCPTGSSVPRGVLLAELEHDATARLVAHPLHADVEIRNVVGDVVAHDDVHLLHTLGDVRP